MAKISRKRIARYVVDQLESGSNTNVMSQLAAYIVDENRVNELELIIRDIHTEFETRGTALVDVTSAYAIDETLRTQIKSIVGGKSVELVEHINPELLGGVALETPSRRLDATIRRRLINLREQKV